MLELFVNNPFEIEIREAAPLRKPENDEVKLKIHLGGICGSDLSLLSGKFAHATYPVRPGHELVGTIIEKGDTAKYEVGTRVVILPNTYCGECEFCKQGKTNICVNKKSLGINLDGGFAEEYIVSSKFILPVPDDITDENAVLIEPFAVVVSAFKKVSITPGTTVAIVGSGNIGLFAVALAKKLGAHVTAIDVNEKKHHIARSIGDVRAVYQGDIKDEKFDIVIEAAGTDKTLLQSIDLMKAGGSVVVVGIVPEVNIPMTQIVRNDQTIFGSIIYKFPEDYEETIAYLKDPELNIAPIISKVMPFTEYEKALGMAQSGDYAKIILDFNAK